MNRGLWLVLPWLVTGCGIRLAQSDPPGAVAPPAVAPSLPASSSVSPGKEFNFQSAASRAHSAAPLVKAQNDFGSRLLVRLEAKNQGHKNLLASPTSLWQALALTSQGARGETRTQMKSLLALSGLPDEQLGKVNQAFNALLGEQKGASIAVANSVWFADSFQPQPTFVQMARENFAAGVEKFASDNPAAGAQKINQWVSEHTRKEIAQIVQEADVAGQSALLVNAVYFRGGWETVFDQRQTKPGPFHLASGTIAQVPMMHSERENAYLSGASFEGAQLPYENTSCALWVLLPKNGKTPADVLSELGHESSLHLRASGAVIVSLPRFDIEWHSSLTEELAKMEALPFSGKADFSGMGEPTERISNVIHVCKMRVDEEGTVAAAATAVAVAGGAAPAPQEPKKLDFNRPFVVALVEENSGARLFEGTVYDPRHSG